MSIPVELREIAIGREIYIGHGWLSDKPFTLHLPPPDGPVEIVPAWAPSVQFVVARVCLASDSQSEYEHFTVRSKLTFNNRAYIVESAAVTTVEDLKQAYGRLVATWQRLCRPARLSVTLLPPYRQLGEETIPAGPSNPADSADSPHLRTG